MEVIRMERQARWLFTLKQFTNIEKCNDFLNEIAKDCFVKDVSVVVVDGKIVYTVLYGEQLK